MVLFAIIYIMENRLKLISKYLNKHWLSVLIVSLVLAVILSSLLSLGQNIWFDEGYSIYVAQKPIPELISLVGVDAHPPLYYLTLKLWGTLFNWSEFSLRFLSIIFATAAIAISFFIVKKMAGVKIALGVLSFLIVAPFALRYSYEIRPYAMTSAIVAGGTLLLLYATESKKRTAWIWYSATVAVGMLTLYMSVLIWLGHFAWLALQSWRDKKATPVKIWFLSYVLAVLFFSPWLPTFISQTLNSALPGIGQEINLETLANTTSNLLLFQPASQTQTLLTILVIILLVSLIFMITRLGERGSLKTRKNLIFIGFLTIIPFLILMVLNATSSPFYVSRYLAHFAIFYYLAIGFIVVSSYKILPKFSLLIGVAALAISLIGVINLAKAGNLNFERDQKPAIVTALSNFKCNNDTTFVAQDEYTYLDSWFYLQDCNLKFLRDGEVPERGGYAPLRNSSAQIRNINEVSTPNLIFISWKDTDNSEIFKNSRFLLSQKDIYQKHLIESYRQIRTN